MGATPRLKSHVYDPRRVGPDGYAHNTRAAATKKYQHKSAPGSAPGHANGKSISVFDAIMTFLGIFKEGIAHLLLRKTAKITVVIRSVVFELNRFEINSPFLHSAAETDPAPGVVGAGAEWRTYIYKNRPTARGRESNIKIPQQKVAFFQRFLQKCNSEARRRRPAWCVHSAAETDPAQAWCRVCAPIPRVALEIQTEERKSKS